MKLLHFLTLACLIPCVACNHSPDEDTENKQLIQAIIQDEDFAAVVDNQTLNKGRYESSRMAINFWLDTSVADIGSLTRDEYLSLRERQRQKAAAFGEKLQKRQALIEERLEKMESRQEEINDAAWQQIKTEADEQLGIPAGFVDRYKIYIEGFKKQASRENDIHQRLFEKHPELREEGFLKQCISAYLRLQGAS